MSLNDVLLGEMVICSDKHGYRTYHQGIARKFFLEGLQFFSKAFELSAGHVVSFKGT